MTPLSKTQKALIALGSLLFLGVLRWLFIARITHDEGYMLDVIKHFTSTNAMQIVYNGRWGTRWMVTTGPTISLPLGILAYIIGVPVVVARLYVYGLCSALFYAAGRICGFSGRVALSTAALFFLWVLCLIWRPDVNGSSINLIANVFGEGAAFGFALLCNLLAASEDRRLRQWAWPCAALAVGAKLVAMLAVVIPLLFILFQAAKKKSLADVELKGFALGALILLAWNGYLVSVLGWDEYRYDWTGLWYWIGHGGGYRATESGFALTLMSKMNMMRGSSAEPWVVIGLCALAIGMLAWANRAQDGDLDKLLPARAWRMLSASTVLFFAWFIFLSGRGWMRHLWIGYALLGWLASAAVAQWLDRSRRRWPAVVAFGVPLLLVSFFYGTLPALGPLGSSERWETQRSLAEELSKKHPHARIMVDDWHRVPHIAFFMDRPQYNMREVQPRYGDLFLCDNESLCSEDLEKFCRPEMTEARVGYCLYQK